MNKKGSHVGMILSFVIFITFLIFIYTTLQPTIKTNREKQVILDNIKEELMEKITGNLTTVTLRIIPTGQPTEDCVRFSDISEVTGLGYSLAKEVSGEMIASKRESGEIKISWDRSPKSVKIFYSEQNLTGPVFGSGTCKNLETYGTDYTLNINRDQQVLETKIKNLFDQYKSDHESLREEFGIPADSDFAISTVINGETFGGEAPVSNIDVFSEEVVFQYLNKTAEMNTGKIRISVW